MAAMSSSVLQFSEDFEKLEKYNKKGKYDW